MITLIHGENIAISRKHFIELRDNTSDALTIDGSSLTQLTLAQALQGQGLFAEQKDIFIEEFLTKRKQSKETDVLIAYIFAHQKDHNITFWESKDLTMRQLKMFSQSSVRKFDFPKILFTFLDALYPGNTKQMLSLLHQTIQTEESEFAFFMLVRHIRILLAITEKQVDEEIDEVKRLAPWQLGKLQKQARVFGKEALIHMYHRLFIIESELKTGKLSVSLIQSIDFLLADL